MCHEKPSYMVGESIAALLPSKLSKEVTERGYISNSVLDDLITLNTIQLVLLARSSTIKSRLPISQKLGRQVCQSEEGEGTTSKSPNHRSRSPRYKKSAMRSYRKIFAILVLLQNDMEPKIKHFIDEGVHDGDLPLNYVNECYRRSDKAKCGHFTGFRRRGSFKMLKCFPNWSDDSLFQFDELQYYVAVPFFSWGSDGHPRLYRLNPKHRYCLPFKIPTGYLSVSHFRDSRGHIQAHPIARGGFSQVFRWNLDANHHSFKGQTHVAVKHLLLRNGRSWDDFIRECNTLKSLNGKSDHLIQLLAAYEVGGDFFLIFPWADTHLEGFWENSLLPTPNKFWKKRAIVQWFSKQCAGLAEGLSHIHRYSTGYSWHGDIKPKNVLLFRSEGFGPGTLKLADFGETVLNFGNGMSHLVSWAGLAYTPNYSPPMNNTTMSPCFDIWSLGCLYLEFATWLLGGWNAVARFKENRKRSSKRSSNGCQSFFYMYKDENGNIKSKLKPAIVNVSC